MEKCQYFALQRKKTPLIGFGILASQDRPAFRIVTRGLGNHSYDIAYSDSLEDIRSNEWKYCIQKLEKEIMPKFEDQKTRRKWIVAHFTTLAITLGNTAENRHFENRATQKVQIGAKSEPDLESRIRGKAKRHSLGPDYKRSTSVSKPGDMPGTDHDQKISLPLVMDEGKGMTEALGHSVRVPSETSNLMVERKIPVIEDKPISSLPPSKRPWEKGPWETKQRLAATETALSYQPADNLPRMCVSAGTTPMMRHADPRNEYSILMFPLYGRLAFVLFSAFLMLLAVLARGSSNFTFFLLLVLIVALCATLTIFNNSPLQLHFHVDMAGLYRLGQKHGSQRFGVHRRTPNLSEIPLMIPSPAIKPSRSPIRSVSHGRKRSVELKTPCGEVKAHDSKHCEDSDEEEIVGMQMTVLPHPLENGDVVRLTLEINGIPVTESKEQSSFMQNEESDKRIISAANRSQSIIGVSRILSKTDKIPAGITTSKRTKRKWGEIDPSTFKLRCGPDYKRNGYKKPSEGSFYEIAAVDTFRAKEKKLLSDIGNKVDLLGLLDDGKESGWVHGLPRIWIVVLQVPAYAPSVLASVHDGDGFALCFYFKLSKKGEEEAKEGKGCVKVMKKFLEQPLDITDADRGPHQWKNMVRLANSEDLHLGWVLQSYVTKYNAKPFLSRNCKSYYKGESHFEVDVDIHRFNYVSRQGMFSLRSYLKQLTLDIGFVVQCEADDELPEKLLGCVRLTEMDAENDAVSLPLEDGIDGMF